MVAHNTGDATVQPIRRATSVVGNRWMWGQIYVAVCNIPLGGGGKLPTISNGDNKVYAVTLALNLSCHLTKSHVDPA
jgi:hypothetical protein